MLSSRRWLVEGIGMFVIGVCGLLWRLECAGCCLLASLRGLRVVWIDILPAVVGVVGLVWCLWCPWSAVVRRVVAVVLPSVPPILLETFTTTF